MQKKTANQARKTNVQKARTNNATPSLHMPEVISLMTSIKEAGGLLGASFIFPSLYKTSFNKLGIKVKVRRTLFHGRSPYEYLDMVSFALCGLPQGVFYCTKKAAKILP